MNILLFDMDGVLLEAQGYHRALQETVRLTAESLGFKGVTLSQEDIATFEASGMSSEWDSAATAAGLLLQQAWTVDTQRRLPDSLVNGAVQPLENVAAPSFLEFALRLDNPILETMTPLERAEHLLLSQYGIFSVEQAQVIRSLLRKARQGDYSPTFRLFQELTLGSHEYSNFYPYHPQLNTTSYLFLYDQACLNEFQKNSLDIWLSKPEHAASIITSRPNTPPPGVDAPPEAELGAHLAELTSLPIAGWGSLMWLGVRLGIDPQQILKPHPVHALAALQMALGRPATEALEEAANLGLFAKLSSGWQVLNGALVSVFEDTPGGVRSLLSAQKKLALAGVNITINSFGIATYPYKRQALEHYGAKVYPSLAEALSAAGILPN
jgi:beta-phosphoglucomutase-like phosphatase (HAD superfamily)